MPSLQVRELPEDVYERLRSRAAAEHRSIAQETIVLLRAALSVPQARKTARVAILDRIQRRAITETANLPPSDALIREDRDR